MSNEIIVEPAALDDHATTLQGPQSSIDCGPYAQALAAFLAAPNEVGGDDLDDHSDATESLVDGIHHLGTCCANFAEDIVAMDNAHGDGPTVTVEMDSGAFSAMIGDWSHDAPSPDWTWSETPPQPWPSGGSLDDYLDNRVPAADPVDTFDGALWRVDDDIAIWDPRPGLTLPVPGSHPRSGIRLQRWFHSARSHRGFFGIGWASMLDARLSLDGTRAGLHTEDGSVLPFTRHGDTWDPDRGVRAELLKTPDGWLATTGSGRLYEFDDRGDLIGLTELHAANLAPLVAADLADAEVLPTHGVHTATWLRHHVTISRDQNGHPLSLTLFDDSTIELTLSDGLVVGVDAPTTSLRYGYHDDLLTTVTRPDRVGHYSWDDHGRLVSVHRGDELLVRSQWDQHDRVVAQVDYDGGHWDFHYGSNRTTTVTRPDGSTWVVRYSREGEVVSLDTPQGGATWHRDHDGHVIALGGDEPWERQITDTSGHMTRDGRDVVSLELAPDGTTASLSDDLGRRWLLQVDTNATTIRGEAADPGVELAINRDGNSTQIVSRAGMVTVTDDGEGHLLSIDGPGATTSYDWDDDLPTRAVQTTDAGLRTVTTIQRVRGGADDSIDGNADRGSDGNADRGSDGDADHSVDGLGTTDAATPPAADAVDHDRLKVTTSRGGHELVTEIVDRSLVLHARTTGDGRQWRWERDALGRVTRATAPGNRWATWRHGLHGLHHRCGPDGNLAIEWSPAGDIREVTFPDGRRTTLDWHHGQVVACDTGTGEVRIVRDDRGRMTALEGGNTATWERDDRGWVVSRHDRAGTVKWLHDDNGRVVQTVQEGLPTVGHVRDRAGRVVAMTIGDDVDLDVPASTIRVPRDLNGPGGTVRAMRDNGTTRHELPNGMVVTQTLHERGSIATRQVTLGERTLWNEAVERNDGFQLQEMTTSLDGDARAMAIQRDERGWAAGAIIEGAWNGDHSITYDHDDAGRRRGWTDARGRHHIDLDDRGRTVTVHGPNGDRHLAHDAAGRVTRDGDWKYTWDAAGGLVAATDGVTSVTHTLDAAGRRVRSVTYVAGQTVADRRWIWDTSHALPRIAAVHDHLTGRREVVRWGIDGTPLAIIDPDDDNRSRWLITDHLGSVRAEVNNSGDILRRRTYGPFGEVIEDVAASTTGTPLGNESPQRANSDTDNSPPPIDSVVPLLTFGFVGSIEDVETGHLHLHTRQYDPTLGRFLAPDPIQAAIGTVPLDGYVYCANQPTELHDPGGAWPGFIEDAAKGVGNFVEGGADLAMDAAGAAKDVIDAHVPRVGGIIDFVADHKTEIMTGLAVVGTVAAVAVTGGAALGVLAPVWVGTVGTTATIATGALAATSAVEHASEREWGPMAFDVAAMGLAGVGVSSGRAAARLLEPFRISQPILTPATLRAALQSSDDVVTAFTGTFVEHFWYNWPLTGIDYGLNSEPSPML